MTLIIELATGAGCLMLGIKAARMAAENGSAKFWWSLLAAGGVIFAFTHQNPVYLEVCFTFTAAYFATLWTQGRAFEEGRRSVNQLAGKPAGPARKLSLKERVVQPLQKAANLILRRQPLPSRQTPTGVTIKLVSFNPDVPAGKKSRAEGLRIKRQ